MSIGDELFTVDVLASGARVGGGPLYQIESIEIISELDKAGQVTLTLPATDSRAVALLTAGRQYNVYTVDGLLASGIVETFNIDTGGDGPSLNVTGSDLLGELRTLNTGYDRVYSASNTETAIIGANATAFSLLYGTGWGPGSISIDADVQTVSIEYNAATVLQALISLASQIGHHFRAGTTARTLDFGTFGDTSGIRITNVHACLPGQLDVTDLAFCQSVAYTETSGDIENRMYPLGKNKFDLRDASATLTDIYVQTSGGPQGFATTADDTTSGATIPVTATTSGGRAFRVGDEVFIGDADDWTQDHEVGIIQSVLAGVSITLTADLENTYSAGADVLQRPQFYIQDATSIAAYGLRESCPQFNWIGYGSTGQGDGADVQEQLAAQLYYAAKARMLRYKDPYEDYRVTNVYNLPVDLRVGQKLRLSYVGVNSVDGVGTQFLNINTDLYVMKITRRLSGDGMGGRFGICQLELANVQRPAPNNQNLLIYSLDSFRWIGL